MKPKSFPPRGVDEFEASACRRTIAPQRGLHTRRGSGAGIAWDADDNLKFRVVLSDGARSGDLGDEDRVLEDTGVEAGKLGFTDDSDGSGRDFQGDATEIALTGRVG